MLTLLFDSSLIVMPAMMLQILQTDFFPHDSSIILIIFPDNFQSLIIPPSSLYFNCCCCLTHQNRFNALCAYINLAFPDCVLCELDIIVLRDCI